MENETIYEMMPESVALNVPIDSKEFAFPVKAGFHIRDQRSGNGVSYYARKDLNLQLNRGQIDFTDGKLFRTMPPLPRVANAAVVNNMRRFIVVAVCLSFIFLFSFLLYRRHKNIVFVG
jgi:hypothetical protein